MSDRIKVAGYAQRIFFDNNIEFRPYSPDLVGLQLASNGGTPLFTMGNFSITTNTDSKLNKNFVTSKFSNFVTLASLDLSLDDTNTLLSNNTEVILNLDKTDLTNYALFGSLSEFVRVSLENIITNWTASLYLSPISQTDSGQVLNGYTFENYSYDSITELASFRINTNFINNKFQLNYLKNGSIVDTFNSSNDLRNLTVNYPSYVVYYNNIEYPVIGFTGSTYAKNDYVYLVIKGDAFSGFGQSSRINYHIKPNKTNEDKFFNSLPDFEAYLLNRQSVPIYTATFNYPIKSDSGVILYTSKSLTWPVSDGYNIDFDTTQYIDYAGSLVDISTDNDLYKSNLMNRFLVSESISDFDTAPVRLSDLDQDTSGQKMNKMLQLYGRSFDEINNFISGIAYANVVSYDKKNNTPDVYLKNIAKVLGWELISSILEHDLLDNYTKTTKSTYSGQTMSLTPVEADVELWRRLILNTPWIWKSKGTRKGIEFLLKFIGIPRGLVTFNEYIYKADGPIDINLFQDILELNNLDTDLSLYPIDSEGYPSPLANTSSMYFQNDGLWYRETSGSGSTIDILTGNNPHLGPYDRGSRYINQFKTLIPNFSAVTISSQTITEGSTNLFTNYNLGVITDYSGETFVSVTNEDDSSLDNCIVVTSSVIPDPNPSIDINDCGCSSQLDDDSLSICIGKDENIPQSVDCNSLLAGQPYKHELTGTLVFPLYQYNQDGTIYKNSIGNPIANQSSFIEPTCCTAAGGTPYLYNQLATSGNQTYVANTGYVCCYENGKCGCKLACSWLPQLNPVALPQLTPSYSGPQTNFIVFNDGVGQHVVTPDGCNCIGNPYTITVPNVTDPFTGDIGYACQLTSNGMNDLTHLGTNGVIYKTYYNRTKGVIGCTAV